ncbi:hypothetical protein GGR52DRAFT_590972 [Hypoxylon sp. FL1284]|nr:hypothetical protein GGR52DRAFT_590972 [Hypoxylon sp. FL1284]
MAPTTILITGANRGLGLGLLRRYLAQPEHVVIAGNRDPGHASSRALAELPRGPGSRLIVVGIDACGGRKAADAAVRELQEVHGIDTLDVVVANAGISFAWPVVADLEIDVLKAHVEPNVYGVVALYQATRPLLRKSTREPVFAAMGSVAGRVRNQPPIRNAAYGPSKAALNWLTVRIDAEDEWLNALVLIPGFVQTDLGNAGAAEFGVSTAEITVDESCDGMVRALATTSKEKHGGRMLEYTGEVLPW